MRVNLTAIPTVFLQPVQLFREYSLSSLRPDVIAGLTIAVILLPQGIAYALIAELPPQTGLYAAIVAAIVGALWGSSNHLQTGPTNAISLLILSTLMVVAAKGTAEYLILAGLMAVLAGAIQLAMGLARLGVLVNFVSHSVIVGFSSGAGILIAVQQLRYLLGLEYSSHGLVEAVQGVVIHLPETHLPTLALGLGTMALIILLRRLNPKLPGPLIAMVAAALAVGLLGLDEADVAVIGELPRGLPPLTRLPVFNLRLVAQLSTGALAVAAIGLVEAMSIARSIASQSGQRLDSNQEFVGQGLSNIAAGFFSGYPCSGSFTRSAVNYDAGGQTRMASLLSGVFVLIAMLVLAPFAAYVPRAALAGVLILTAYSMIQRDEIARIWRGARADAVIMVVTFLATLFLDLEFAVLGGILISFGVYIMKTSMPEVSSVLPDHTFRHFAAQSDKPPCPQLAIVEVFGDLYFGAVSHVEDTILEHMDANPQQRFLLLRMHSVDQCDFSGIHALECILRSFRERGGDLYLVRVHEPVLELMRSTGYYDELGGDHILTEEKAISHLFHKALDPAVCIYECDVRAFKECQNLPKQTYGAEVPCLVDSPLGAVATVSPRELWEDLGCDAPRLVVDVREPREFEQGHVPGAQLMPLPLLLSEPSDLPDDQPVVLVCRGGRRSTRAACVLAERGYDNIAVLEGGMLAWEADHLLEAIDRPAPQGGMRDEQTSTPQPGS
jgi:SulP family sulfate permease